MSKRIRFGRGLRLCLAAACALLAFDAPANPAREPVAPAHVLDKSDLEAFFDGLIPLQLERGDIAGASVLVMQGSEVLLKKGYGFSDVKSKKPVDPETTMFRLASISKLFTWTAAMQLVEQHKLALDAAIDRYLDFPIKRAAGIDGSITLRHLMTHTGGFEETVRNIIVTDSRHYPSLRDFLVQSQPKRLFAPGTVPAYSNYGVGLGSYIVQRVSGEPFEQYVAEHIFAPLGMTHSTFYQPPPKALSDLPSEGYTSNTTEPAIGFERFSPVGAGGLSSTAGDMGRFAQALLNGGELDGQRILQAETLGEMWKTQFAASDQLPHLGLGFYQTWRNQLKWIGHGGDLVAFHSIFFIEPEQKLALFISYNSAGSAPRTRVEILNDFSDRYFPAAQQPAVASTPPETLKEIEGSYEPTRRADSTILKVLALFGQMHAKIDKDGVLHIDKFKDLRGHPFAWKPIGKDLWQQVDEQGRLFAIRGADGGIERLAVSFPGVQLQRVPWYERDRGVLAVLGLAVLALLCVVFNAVLRLVRRYLLRAGEPVARPARVRLDAISVAASVYWLVLLGTLMGVIVKTGGDDAMPPTSAWDLYLLIADGCALIAVVLSAFTLWSAVRVWGRAGSSRISQVKYTLTALACVALSWFVLHWHVIGPTHRY